MGQDQAAAVEIVTMFAELLQTQMEVETGAMQRALADEEIAAGDVARQSIEPAGISGVGDGLPAEANAIAVRVGFGLVRGREGIDLSGAREQVLLGMDFAKMDREAPLSVFEAVAHRPRERAHAALDLGRAYDFDRMFAGIGVERA